MNRTKLCLSFFPEHSKIIATFGSKMADLISLKIKSFIPEWNSPVFSRWYAISQLNLNPKSSPNFEGDLGSFSFLKGRTNFWIKGRFMSQSGFSVQNFELLLELLELRQSMAYVVRRQTTNSSHRFIVF